MKENTYDRDQFFNAYSQMNRSTQGLAGAGEWHELQKLMPDFTGKRVLDLGCGFGWHCRYAVEHGAKSVLGLDLSQKMLAEAEKRNGDPNIQYRRSSIEDYDYPEGAYDVVVSSLAFHYVADFPDICRKVAKTLVPGGQFVFSAEHPIFTAEGRQDWLYDQHDVPLCWPVDRYFTEGKREALFLGENVVKYHKTLTTYINGLLQNGFAITDFKEPEPDPSMMEQPGMKDELRRPMMMLISAVRK